MFRFFSRLRVLAFFLFSILALPGSSLHAQATGAFGGTLMPSSTFTNIFNAQMNATNSMVVSDAATSTSYPFDTLSISGSGYSLYHSTTLSVNYFNGASIDDNGDLTYCYENSGSTRINTRIPNGSGGYTPTYNIYITGGGSARCTSIGNGTVYHAPGDGTLNVAVPSGSTFTVTAVSGAPAGIVGVAAGYNGNLLLAATGGTYAGKVTAGVWTGALVTTRLFYNYAAYQDANGTVYLEDSSTQAGYQYTLTSGSYTESSWTKPFGFTANSYSYNISGTLMAAAATYVELQFPSSLTFPAVAVATADPVEELVYKFTTGGSVGGLTVSANGGATDFANVGTGTCSTNGSSYTYSVGDICTVNVSFTPTRGGARTGVVTLKDASNSTIGTASLTGTGIGPTVDHLAFTTIPTATPTGSSFSVTVKAYTDAAGTSIATFVNGTTATVTSNDSAATLPTGVTFTSGVATFNITLNTAGSKTITVSDDGGGESVTSSGINVTSVDHFTLTGLPTTTTAGLAINGTVTAYSTSGATVATSYTGPVVITSSDSNATLPANLTLSNGTASFSVTLKTTPSQTITAATTGGTPTVTSNSITVNTAAAASVSAAMGSGQSATIGSAITNPLVVQVIDAFSNPIGGNVVNFTAPASGASAALSAPSCTTSLTNTLAGSCSITATANGTASAATYTVSAVATGVTAATSFSLTNNKFTPTLSVSASPTTLVFGQPVTITATSVPVSAGGSYPTGPVTFYANGNAFSSTSTPSSGVSTYPTYAQVGPQVYAASTAADTNFNAVTMASAASINVSKASSTLNGPATQPVQVTVNTTGSIPVGVGVQYSYPAYTGPTGSLSYTITPSAGGSSVANGSLPLGGGGAVIPVASTLAPGVYNVVVNYGGDTNLNAATAITISLQVGQITPVISYPAQTAITYGTALNANNLNASVTYNSSSVAANGTFAYTVTPTGGTSVAVAAGTVLPAGAYTLGVIWTPTTTNAATYKAVITTSSIVVNKATPSVALVSSVNPVLVQNATILTVTVSSTASTPSGTVQFLDGTTPIGTAQALNTSGVAALSVSTFAVGTHSITAVYSGDSNFVTATSIAVSEQVNDFNLTLSTSSSVGSSTTATVLPGALATYSFTISPTGTTTFPAPVTLTVSGLPAGATYTITPTTLAAGSGTTNVTLVVTTPQQSAMLHSTEKLAPFALALLVLPFSRRMRSKAGMLGRLAAMLLLLLAGAASVVGLTGCGTSTGYFGQQPHTYTVTITGTSGALVHSTSVTLIVQ